MLGVKKVAKKDVKKYGIIASNPIEDSLYEVTDLVEKPKPEEAPSQMAVMGRYIIQPEIFDILAETKPGAGGEIQLTDALRVLRKKQKIYAYAFEGNRYDIGDKLGFLIATVEFALKREELAKDFKII